MIDRMIFGMRVLIITQVGSKINHRNNLSHTQYELDLAGSDSGIDYWYNMMPNTFWYCAGSFGTRSTGNTRFYWSTDAAGHPKKVLCADGKSRVITLALTHSNQNYSVGSILGYKQIIYQEGTAGKATGNHIHLECCEGCIKTKVRNSKGYYNLPNMLDPRRVFFILDGFTTVKNSLGLVFKHCSSIEGRTEMIGNGFHQFKANGVTCSVYKGKHIGLIVPDKPAQLMDMDAEVQILSKCGNDLYEMTGSAANPAGQIYGPYSAIDHKKSGQPADSKNYLYFQVDNDGKVSYGDWDGVYRDPDGIEYLCSPQSIFSDSGIKYALYRGSAAYTAAWYWAYVVHFSDGTFGNGVSRGAVQPKYIWQALRELGADVVAFMDGGSGGIGSAQQLYWDGSKMTTYQSSGRAVADITVIYNKAVGGTSTERPTESTDAAKIAALKAQVEGLSAQLEAAAKEAETAKSDRDAVKAEAAALEEKIKKIREIVA
ncbi:hypothetical protein [Stecheria intestinalis]|uniref:hypothetical protein n=1 Tax=Stecheria intestinalis TaxID=2606630 RepID=UPI0023F3F573|nr:hypothetical protein [Stecheria intestinalis]MDD5880990.1 hypothetical protein [Stecheria intestinalis]